MNRLKDKIRSFNVKHLARKEHYKKILCWLNTQKSFIFFISSIISFLIFTLLLHQNYNLEQKQINLQRHSAEKSTADGKKKLEHYIKILKETTQAIATQLENIKNPCQEDIERLIKEASDIGTISVIFNPNYQPAKKVHALSFSKKLNLIKHLNSHYNNQKFKEYCSGEKSCTPFLKNPQSNILLEFGIPFYNKNKGFNAEPIGIIIGSTTREHINNILSHLFIEETGYWFLVSKHGVILTHPSKQLLSHHQRLGELENEGLKSLDAKIKKHQRGHLFYLSEVTQIKSLLCFHSIKNTDWHLCGVLDSDNLYFENNTLRHRHIHISLALFLSLTFLILGLLFFRNNHSKKIIALYTLFFSIIFLGETATIWYTTYNYPYYKGDINSIKSKIGLYNALKKTNLKESAPSCNEAKQKEFLTPYDLHHFLNFKYNGNFIPTGIYINHINLEKDTLDLSFILWQRYSIKNGKNIPKGFLLPQATKLSVEKISDITNEDSETILWQVRCSLNQALDLTSYPLDAQELQLQIWPKNFAKNITLVPDFNAYRLINPLSLPGLGPQTLTGSLRPKKSFFCFIKNNYKTNFGIYNYKSFHPFQEAKKSNVSLSFNITTQRKLLDTIISDLFPIVVIAILLFIIFAINVTGYAFIGSAASLLLGLVLAHVRFRTKIPSYSFVFFDNIYFIIYGALLFIVVANSAVINKNVRDKAKLLYWPLLFCLTLLISLIYLY